MAKYTQDLHRISVETPLGKDKFYLKAFNGQEEISRLFRFNLHMFSDDAWIDPKSIVGKNITVTLKHPNGPDRYFNGIVSRFAYQGTGDRYSDYFAEMVPTLGFLTRTADCRIFQEMEIPAIIKQVFSLHGLTSYKVQLTKTFPKREYCVQYRETAFNFVSRLMEQYGIFYYFKHADGSHTMVLGDSTSAYEDCADDSLSFRRDIAGNFDLLTGWEHRFEYCEGKWTHTDYNFETPKTDLKATTNSVVSLSDNSKYEIFDYPGEYTKKDEGTDLVRVRMEEDEVPYEVVSGASVCRSFTPGGKFTVTQHISPSEDGKKFVLASVSHAAMASDYATGPEVMQGGGYKNTFTCVPDLVVLRPARITPNPVIQGSQTALVVGPPGEEIYPDKYGRIKVQFYWDRIRQERRQEQSRWIRCMQLAAARTGFSVDIPRIGQEVVVFYLEGDPDRPVITGVVYNADQMPAYTLPDEKTKTWLKTDTSMGGEGHNEIPLRGQEGQRAGLHPHAERNMDCPREEGLHGIDHRRPPPDHRFGKGQDPAIKWN